MLSKVLVPVDTARNSLTAEEYAIRFNWRLPMNVTLLSVVNSRGLEIGGLTIIDKERISASQRRQTEEVLAEAAEPFRRADMEFETRIEFGSPGSTICKVAEQEGYDLVIIAQSGLSEWNEMLGGSVARYVLYKCKVPVLFLKHTQEQMDVQRRLRAEEGLLPR
ncbi:MAG: universal stress protein [Desulfarculus sp.]|nr:universal stress protein [Desulfarculus sp.]